MDTVGVDVCLHWWLPHGRGKGRTIYFSGEGLRIKGLRPTMGSHMQLAAGPMLGLKASLPGHS